MRAALAVRARNGQAPKLEIMIPLVDYERELELMREPACWRSPRRRASPTATTTRVGTMIELPRACFVADRIARHADFFSFGTNDLTQTALGFSRDDVEGRIVPRYIERQDPRRSPVRDDRPGRRRLARAPRRCGSAAQGVRTSKLGICGEHGGDPDSIDFFHDAGLDYVSCSPFRLPIARVAAAQAAVANPQEPRF